MKQMRTWILIADGGKARVLSSEGTGSKLSEYAAMRLRAADLLQSPGETDRPGRVQESASPARHAIEPRVPTRRQVESDFARHVAKQLDEQLSNFERLVVVAAPRTLGDLRGFVSPAVEKKLQATVSKDLTNTPDEEILELLKDDVKL